MKNILILNASLSGAHGNSASLLTHFASAIQDCQSKFPAQCRVLELDKSLDAERLAQALDQADALVFLTGTYWDSWSSHLQYFLELATEWEASKKFLGKPVAVLVTMHSVGGKEVMSRLQGVLNTFGCVIPPMSGVAISLATEIANKSDTDFADDFWSAKDLKVVAHNLLSTCYHSSEYLAWDVDRKDPTRVWLK